MGASTRAAAEEVAVATCAATAREVMGSMVEQSMNRRVVGDEGRGEWSSRMEAKTDWTWLGSGREVMIVVFSLGRKLVCAMRRGSRHEGCRGGGGIRSEDWLWLYGMEIRLKEPFGSST
ncbi:hypothetical protein FH972_022441 [Carpinus fangiana]|uniref:Uncharacterized protein n=1 Tax=Carpinus fangiana TaxID=176857 RepID=A0A5N6KUI5_9ROSI|nr:hypothetical protein FH972_022441 [Carpinus fangiana]